MNKIILLLLTACLLATGCSVSKKESSATSARQPATSLEGNWILDLIPHPTRAFDSLYPGKKPELSFETGTRRFSGYTGCNRINGPLVSEGTGISFKGDIAMTKMACAGEGEAVFMEQLKRINKYAISADGRELTLIQGDVALMRFHKQ